MRGADVAEFREVQAGEVPERQRRLAGATLRIVARDLGLGRIAIRWFRPQDWRDREERRALGRAPWTEVETGANSLGFVWGATPNTIWVKAGLGADDTTEVVAHECRHAWQRQRAGRW